MYKIFRPFIFKLDAEKAHNLAIGFLKYLPRLASVFSLNKNYENLAQNICGIDFKNPIGMAAGFDKNGEIVRGLANFGFGFVEVGTVTPKAQEGNEKPRIFRLAKDRAVVNRLGFNNLGASNLAQNIAKIDATQALEKGGEIVLGVNIGKNKTTQNAVSDYLELLEKFYEKASYITLNISSPNTDNLRDLQGADHLDNFLARIMDKKYDLQLRLAKNTPIWLKVAPDLTFEQQKEIAKTALKHKIDALIISNTTIERPDNLQSQYASKQGGLSGAPLFEKSNEVLRNFYKLTDGKIPLIGVGGVSCALDAYEKIKMGASLVQIYSGFVYEGFGLVERVNRELSEMVRDDGFGGVGEVVGIGV